MKKYLMFKWVLEGGGWLFCNTLDETKNDFYFGCMIWEIPVEDEEILNQYGQNIQSNRLMIQHMKDKNYPLVSQDGEPFKHLVTK